MTSYDTQDRHTWCKFVLSHCGYLCRVCEMATIILLVLDCIGQELSLPHHVEEEPDLLVHHSSHSRLYHLELLSDGSYQLAGVVFDDVMSLLDELCRPFNIVRLLRINDSFPWKASSSFPGFEEKWHLRVAVVVHLYHEQSVPFHFLCQT